MEDKLSETRNAIKNGADEIDYVVNLTKLKAGDTAYIESEMARITDICREFSVVSKVIFENCYLTEDEKKTLCHIATKVKPDFIKTSTGFGTGGATFEDVALMKRETEGSGVKIKVAGGIRTLKTALEMINLGVSRIGSTSSVAIMEEYMANSPLL